MHRNIHQEQAHAILQKKERERKKWECIWYRETDTHQAHLHHFCVCVCVGFVFVFDSAAKKDDVDDDDKQR